jgi:hypothetical protein
MNRRASGISSLRWQSEVVLPRLRDQPDDLYALVSTASDAMRIPVQFVEKDFWVTEVLRAVVAGAGDADTVAVFKGGTSLSKGYGLIERFSEDVDILLVPPDGHGAQARHQILKRICRAVAAHLGHAGEDGEVLQSETGIKRNVRFAYASRFGGGSLSEGVLLEMGVRGGPHPRTSMQLRSLAAQYALNSGSAASEFDEFASIDAEVLASERTLVEKLALLHVLAGTPDDHGRHAGLGRSGRHYYDVYQLLGHQPTLDACAREGHVAALAEDICAQSRRYGWPFSPRPALGYASSPAFDPAHESSGVARSAYRRASELVYGAVPTFEECLARVHLNGSLL